jgi:TetR/AcrR family transcriptional regulator, fatty acid metabolism regulator protein
VTESQFSDKNGSSRPRPTRRSSSQRADKQARILAAAADVFVKNGFHETHISHIARAAGVADGTIYLYFPSKEALLAALFEHNVSRFFAVLDSELDALGSPREKLLRILDLQLGLLDRERGLAELLTVNLRQSSRAMRQHVAPHFIAYLDRIEAVVAEGQSSGQFRTDISPRVAARAVFGALDGVTLTWALGSGHEGGLVKAAETVGKVLLDGLLAKP